MILIYVSYINARISYITRFIFGDVLKVQCKLTMNRDEFLQYTGPKINYSFEELDAITILPNKFLLQKGITEIDVGVSWVNGTPVLFHECADVALPFDPFAASFYLITRYEEYITSERDEHGRFIASSSLAYKHGFLEMPVIDQWALMIRRVIEMQYPVFSFPEKKYVYIPTIDIDIAYAYRGRSLLRIVGAVLKSGFNVSDQFQRLRTLLGATPDPYDTFSFIETCHSALNMASVYFFQVGKYGKFDKNLQPGHSVMQRLISEVGSRYEIGIHPSYQSQSEYSRVKDELHTLNTISGKDITKSRQHFLRVTLPRTYQTLEACGISEDYSMGYADRPGFRAGTCTPFMFYDLSTEKETKLKVFPFCIMDGTLNQYLGLSPEDAILKVKELALTVKKYDGTMVTIWHNQSLSETADWKGWKSVYPGILQAMV